MRANATTFPLFLLVLPTALAAQSAALSSLNKTLMLLASRADHARTYSWEGDMVIDARRGAGPFVIVSQSKIQLALAEDGKSLLKMQTQGSPEYWLVSDGKKSWSYLPGKKEYSEEESAAAADTGDGDSDNPANQEESGGTTEEQYARVAVPNIAEFVKQAASLSTNKTAALKLAGEKVNWPIITIVGKPDKNGTTTVAELVMAPDQPTVGRLVWVTMPKEGSTAPTVRVTMQFREFSVGQPLVAGLFTFDPPKKAKLVEELVIPGQAEAALLNHPSPDFEARTLAGDKIKLSDFHGKVVMLNFWASWCPPCRAELPTVAKLHGEFKDKGLVVYGVNDEDRSTARKYLDKAGLALPTIDDSSRKAHKLYRVTAIPTVYLINADGKVVKWFRGGHSEESLRAALKSAGVEMN